MPRFSDIVNYLIWRVIFSRSDQLNKKMRDRNLEFKKVLTGIETDEARWKKCVEVVFNNFPIATSAMYVQKYFNKESKNVASDIVMSIKEEFEEIIKAVPWMDGKTRETALEKAKKMVTHIGYPDELLDDSKLIEYYGSLNIDQEKYFESITNISKFTIAKTYQKLREPVNKNDWENHAGVAIINAFYNPLENNIRKQIVLTKY